VASAGTGGVAVIELICVLVQLAVVIALVRTVLWLMDAWD
jgi:hypothetical protein